LFQIRIVLSCEQLAISSDDDKFINEAADLLFHFLVLLNIKKFTLRKVLNVLQKRHKQ
jgi:phosphoribosyl-ATP pyrophosphohydrolase/phosphoribosyl-AMP cyclohydrolase